MKCILQKGMNASIKKTPLIVLEVNIPLVYVKKPFLIYHTCYIPSPSVMHRLFIQDGSADVTSGYGTGLEF